MYTTTLRFNLRERELYMFYQYKFWHSLMHPTYFTQAVEQGELRGYKSDPSQFLYSFAAIRRS